MSCILLLSLQSLIRIKVFSTVSHFEASTWKQHKTTRTNNQNNARSSPILIDANQQNRTLPVHQDDFKTTEHQMLRREQCAENACCDDRWIANPMIKTTERCPPSRKASWGRVDARRAVDGSLWNVCILLQLKMQSSCTPSVR